MPTLPLPTRIGLDGDAVGVATLTLIPADGKPPTLHESVLDELDEAVAQIEADRPRSVVIRSASHRFFCVGADISALETLDASAMSAWVERGHRVFNRLSVLPCPVIAGVGGYALGGGLELAMACDIVVVDRTAKLGLTEASLGLVPGWGGVRRLAARIGVGRAKAMFFTGDVTDASEAARIGLADRLVDDLDLEIEAITAAIGARGEIALRGFKAVLAEPTIDRYAACHAEAMYSVECMEDESTRQRIRDFLDARAAR